MEAALTAIIVKIVEAGGPAYALAAFYFRWDSEVKDRRACDDRMHALTLQLKDESHARVAEANTRQDTTFSKVGDALVALTAEVRALSSKGADR